MPKHVREIVLCWSLASVLGLGCAPPKGGEPESPSPDPATGEVSAEGVSSQQAALLQELRRRLEALAAAPGDQYAEMGGDLDVTPIVGLSQEALRKALGAPHTCTENLVTDGDGNARPVAPCASNHDWFYSFYRLPEGWLGGGPELLLLFDADGVVTSASWAFTQ